MAGKLYAAYDKRLDQRVIAIARDSRQQDRFFEIVQRETGLDRTVAALTLEKTGEIDHPEHKFLYATEEILRALGPIE